MNSADLLKAYREQRGITQGDLAKELNETFKGYTTAIISYVEHGKVELPAAVYNYIADNLAEKPFRNPSNERNEGGKVIYRPSNKNGSNRRFSEKDGKKMTQCDRVVDYINRFGSITTKDAFLDLGIARLASRICDLTKRGYEFDREYESCKNRFGDNTSYVRYSFRRDDEQTNVGG